MRGTARAGAAAAGAALLLAVAGCGAEPPGVRIDPVVYPVPVAGAPARGPDDAWVTVVEFSDFECPYCAAEAPVLHHALGEYGQDLRLVYRHFPLSGLHPRARAAAIASVCADAQGLFWPMHDLIFASGGAFTDDDLAALAQQAGADLTAWRECLAAPAAAERVEADAAMGASIGVHGTPTLFVNGEKVEGAVSLPVLRAHVDAALERARASGIPRAEFYLRGVLGG